MVDYAAGNSLHATHRRMDTVVDFYGAFDSTATTMTTTVAHYSSPKNAGRVDLFGFLMHAFALLGDGSNRCCDRGIEAHADIPEHTDSIWMRQRLQRDMQHSH